MEIKNNPANGNQTQTQIQTFSRVAVYARYSSDMQSMDSADDQIRRIRYRIELGQVRSKKFYDRGMQLQKEWILKDEAQSGRLAGRENYERILQGIREKSFDVLVVDDLSRLTRSLGSLLSLFEMLKWYEVELISICDVISSEDASAKTFFTVKGMVNDFSNDIHAERVIRGMEIRALQGFSCGDHPYGYDSKPTKFENAKGRPFPSHFKIYINEAEAQVIRRIFNMYDLGLGYVRISVALNEDGIPSPGLQYAAPGKAPKWSPRAVQHILQNEKYIGIWKWKKTKVGIHPESKLRAAKERPCNEWVTHLEGKTVREDLRIIDLDLWERVQIKLTQNKKVPSSLAHPGRWFSKKTVLPEHPFSGLLECGVCASSFYLVGGKKGGYYGCVSAYRKGICQNRQLIHIRSIEATIMEVLKEKLTDPELCKVATSYYNKAVKAKLAAAPARLEQIGAELSLVESELKNLIQFVVRGNGSESTNAAIKEREVKKTRLLSESHSLLRSQPKFRERTQDEIKARFEGFATAIQDHPSVCYPAIREMFPRKAKLFPKGKTPQGTSLYSMSARILLNGGLTRDFERLIKNGRKIRENKSDVKNSLKNSVKDGVNSNKKGVAVDPQPPGFLCEPYGLGFDTLEIGVTNGA